MLMPTDSYRRLRQNAYTIPNGDAIEMTVSRSGATGCPAPAATHRALGCRWQVFPERDQRIYIMADENAA